jgi:hypothetical protein
MGGRKTDGNEEQKRARAREARERGKAPSEVDATTGAPKQRRHVGGSADHDEKLEARHRNQSEAPSRHGGAPG